MSFISTIFGDANQRYIDSLRPTVAKINALEADFKSFSDVQLKDRTVEFKKRLAEGESLDDLLPEAFASVREASRRVSGKRHFDVQLMGGIALHQGKIAEMRTGEGKTLVATLPAYLNALEDKGVHVVTVNDYLSRRDTVWMGQIYDALGLSVGCLNHDTSYLYDAEHRTTDDQQPTTNNEDALDKERDVEGGFKVVHEFLRPANRRQAYAADITYGTNNEYGFDYLRDNMVYDPASMAQRYPEAIPGVADAYPVKPSREHEEVVSREPSRATNREPSPGGHHFAVVDEVDSILIDEARTPLIISAPDAESTNLYDTFSRVVPHLKEGEDYNVDEKLKAVSITEAGIEKVEKRLGLTNIYDEGGVRNVHHLEQALKAQILFQKDRDYVVKDGEVIIVDEFTGRLMPGRRWSEGLHQAVEAKEGVKIEKESKTLATITFQNYFRLYKKLGGMTGTAKTSAEEFHKVYKLDVVMVPTNKSMIRQDQSDRIYKNETGKFKAIVREIKERHDAGQPVLVGTVSIEKNEVLSAMLAREGITHNVLNAKNHEKEAEIIAQAGRLGGVTVATNMAGRGVDIILGGFPSDDEEAEKVRQAGGLHVIGTERHEARRIDDQLRGRAGRQGDPGSSRFFVSTEDELVRVFGGDRLKNIMERLGVGEDDVIENRFISNAIQQAQGRIEGHNFDIRKYVLEYDDVMNKHREAIYSLRKHVLSTTETKDIVLAYLDEYAENIIRFHASGEEGGWNTEEMAEALKATAPFGDDLHTKLLDFSKSAVDAQPVIEYAHDEFRRLYESKEAKLGAEQTRRLEKAVLLRSIDELWMDHLEAMEYLRDSVRLRAYGQRDPLVEYKIEAQKMYDNLHQAIRAQVAGIIFKVGFMEPPKELKGEERKVEIDAGHEYQQRDKESAGSPVGADPKIGRNDPCPCGSGKKYKRCHGK